MPRHTIEGCFYEFHRDRPGREIGDLVPRPHAVVFVRKGDDIYTPAGSDARSLAKDVHKGKADWEGSHDDGYYPHYHPAGDHLTYGHVFYGDPGFRIGENRR